MTTGSFGPVVLNCIGGVMVSLLVWNAVDRGFEPPSGQTNDYINFVFVASLLNTQY